MSKIFTLLKTDRKRAEAEAQKWAIHYLSRELNPSELTVVIGKFYNTMLPMFEVIEHYATELGIDIQALIKKPVEFSEADEVSPEDLEAAADMMDKLTSGTSADVQANDWARIYLDRNLTDKELNTVLGRYATSLYPMEAVVRLYSEEVTRKMKTTILAEPSNPSLCDEERQLCIPPVMFQPYGINHAKGIADQPQDKTAVSAVKPHIICVNVDLYYEIHPDTLPGWADELGVEKLVESAFANHNQALTLTGLAEVLEQNPAEISLNSVLIAA